jgi:hypothetical protein
MKNTRYSQAGWMGILRAVVKILTSFNGRSFQLKIK